MHELKGKQGYLKYKPLSNEEENKMVKLERLARYFEEEQFLNLSQMDQYEYISAGYNIPAKTFVKLSKERKNDYLNIMAEDLDREMPEDLEAVLEEREMKRYLALHERAWENHLQGIEAAL
jgi:acetyl-CoA carboxylase carboxyltransferase component